MTSPEKRSKMKRGGHSSKEGYLQKILDAKKFRSLDTENVSINTAKAKNADQHFEQVLANATPADVMGEYYYFLKKFPTLLKTVEAEILDKVKMNLKISEMKQKINQPNAEDKVRKCEDFPILDALSFKMGLCLRNILAPPTQICLLCDKFLTRNHKPTMVPLHTLNGPEMASKYIFECRSCPGIYSFRNRFENNTRIYYHLDQFGNPDIGFKKYPPKFKVNVYRSSSEEYCTGRFLNSYMSDLQHCFSTAEGKAESYNETFRNTEKTEFFSDFLLFNPEVGGHFETKAEIAKADVIDGDGNETKDEKVRNSKMHELGRRNLSSAYYNHEVFSEMVERGTVENVIFGPKIDEADSRRKISYKESIENYMKEVDEMRKDELYKHTKEDCSEACQKRGCGSVASVDGNWKLMYKICLWIPTVKYPDQNILEAYPNICSEEPAYGSAFCHAHSIIAESLGYPSQLRKFITKCGADPNSYTKEGREKVKSCLEKLGRENFTQTKSAEDAQGTGHFLRDKTLANQDNFKMTDVPEESCRKDIGDVQRLHGWSRGIEEFVGGGGIIEYWAPIYKSEGPAQVFLIMIKYLQLRLQNKTEEDYHKFCLSYDNMCHVDSLKISKNPLPLPAPEDKIWTSITKVIDDLHLKNHKRKMCHEVYNPSIVRKLVPEANLMCAEQTFAWQSRYKKVLNSMKKCHFHFVMHRLIKRRNEYTSLCYRENRKPLLPSAKIAQTNPE